MSVRVEAAYQGELQCTVVHGPSQTQIATDAPVDNGGKARTFSPTDLVAAALGTCMLTIVGKAAEARGWSIGAARASVVKEMTSSPPRRIALLRVKLELPAALSPDARVVLERAARTCPVGNSLSAQTQVEIEFLYA